jgi:hypothetical protein
MLLQLGCALSMVTWVLVHADTLEQKGAAMLAKLQTTPCSYRGVDFSVLTHHSSDYMFSSADRHNTWYMNICANTVFPCKGDAALSPAVWNYDFQQPYACFNLAKTDTATWSTVTINGAHFASLSYTGGDTCYNVQPASHYSIQIVFVYEKDSPGQIVSVVNGATACDFVATFHTALAVDLNTASGHWAFVGVIVGSLCVYARGLRMYAYAYALVANAWS